MKEFFNQAKTKISAKVKGLKNDFDSNIKLVKEVVDGLPVFASVERSQTLNIKYDEKHYFVIPYYLSDEGFSLYTMRVLPDEVPEVNELPKRRVFHFPNEHYEGTLRQYMSNAARNMANGASENDVSSIEKLADNIDKFDSKLTYGMLLIGGLAAIFNPLIGAGIAAKALLPSITGSLAKYGLKPLGEKATQSQIEKRAKEAEDHVLQQFSESTTLKVVNPVLYGLEFALRTTESQHDPLLDINFEKGEIKGLEHTNWRDITEVAIYRVYKEVIEDESLHAQARLGPEDIRWLKVLLADKLNH